MKAKDIINESNTDHIAKYYRTDNSYEPDNTEANEYAENNKERYRQLFRDFYKRGETFIFDNDDHCPKQPTMTNQPDPDSRPTPAYRGINAIRRKAGLSYDKDAFN